MTDTAQEDARRAVEIIANRIDLNLSTIKSDSHGYEITAEDIIRDFLDCGYRLYRTQWQPMQWQPIKTAPKNGTEFIGYSSGGRRGVSGWTSYVCKWDRNLWIAVGEGVVNPSHWLPLPDPPDDDVRF